MRAALYARVSRDRDGNSTSVEQQVTECRKYADSRGWDVVTVLSDNDISAYTGKRRPSYLRLLEIIESRECDAVIVWEQSRLTRTPAELEHYMEICEPRSIPTYTVVAGTLDLTTDQGRMIARIVGATNRYEVDQLRGRVKRGMRDRAARGEPVGGRRPFGFESDRVTHRPVEADAIRDACASLLAGDSVHGIARDWRKRSITTTTGLAWSPTQVRTVLRRPRNAGLAEHRGETLGSAKWDPIVSVATWSKVCALLADPARKVSPGNRPAYLGTYIYRCGVCGNFMRSWRSGHKPIRVYRCEVKERTERHPTIPIESADEYVTAFIVAGLHELGFSTDPIEDEPAFDRDGKIAELETRRRNYLRLHATGAISDADLDDTLQLIGVQLKELESDAPPVDARTDVSTLLGAKGQHRWSELSMEDQAAMIQRFHDLPLDRRRAIVEEYSDVEVMLSQSRGQPVHERIRITLNLSVD